MDFNKNNATVSYNVKDSTHITAVSVIVTFNVKGEMRPDYVQIIQPDGSRETFKIYDAKITDQVRAYIRYSCNIVSNERLKEINLTYFIDEHMWFMGK